MVREPRHAARTALQDHVPCPVLNILATAVTPTVPSPGLARALRHAGTATRSESSSRTAAGTCAAAGR